MAVPFCKYSGKLVLAENPNDEAIASNQNLVEFLTYLESKKELLKELQFNFQNFTLDLEEGLFFDSTISVNYGLGSSGALVASVFKRYADKKLRLLPFEKLREVFATAESFFHGNSSGIDPLTSYLSKPLLFSQQKLVEIDRDLYQNLRNRFYLFNSGIRAETSNLVDVFHKKLTQEGFSIKFKKEYVKQVNYTINQFTVQDPTQATDSLRILSEMQLKYFREMIPKEIYSIWKAGLNSGKYIIKLCGSGGGGYFLVYSLLPASEFEEQFNGKLESF